MGAVPHNAGFRARPPKYSTHAEGAEDAEENSNFRDLRVTFHRRSFLTFTFSVRAVKQLGF